MDELNRLEASFTVVCIYCFRYWYLIYVQRSKDEIATLSFWNTLTPFCVRVSWNEDGGGERRELSHKVELVGANLLTVTYQAVALVIMFLNQ